MQLDVQFIAGIHIGNIYIYALCMITCIYMIVKYVQYILYFILAAEHVFTHLWPWRSGLSTGLGQRAAWLGRELGSTEA